MRKFTAPPSILLFLLLSACTFGDYFAEYRGVNLIESLDFSSGSWLPEAAAVYMDFSSVTALEAGGTTGLPAGTSDLYRLEIKNLAVNGDFEAALGGDWTQTGGTMNLDSSAAAIDGQSLYYVLGFGERIDFNLKTGLTDTFIDNGYYQLRFNFKTSNYGYFEYNDGTTNLINWIIVPDPGVVRSFPVAGDDSEVTAAAAANYNLTLGTILVSGDPQSGYLDNLKVTRTDVDKDITLSLAYSDVDYPDLISGTYRFSVYMKAEENSQVTPTPTALNRFRADSLRLRISGRSNSTTTITKSETFTPTAGWTKVSTDLFIQIEPPTDPTEEVMQLSILPTDPHSPNVGSILIAAPSLEFLSD